VGKPSANVTPTVSPCDTNPCVQSLVCCTTTFASGGFEFNLQSGDLACTLLFDRAWLEFRTTRDVDSQTLRDILAELRAIHNNIRINETTPLLVAELQMQQNVVNRATENTNNAQSKPVGIHRDHKLIAIELQDDEEMLDKSTNQDEKKGISETIERAESNGMALKAVAHDLNTELVEMQHRLSTSARSQGWNNR
jgi:hypothetical protein